MRSFLRRHKYGLLVLTGLALWLIETAAFGWNHKAQSVPEEMLNVVAWVFVIWGVVGDWVKGMEWHKHEHTNIAHQDAWHLKLPSNFSAIDAMMGKRQPDKSGAKKKPQKKGAKR